MATQSKLNKINVSQVLRCIWFNKGISRIQIANNLQMDKSTVTKIVSNLLELGIVETMKEGKASPLGGRKPVPLIVNTSFGCILGIDIQEGISISVIIDLQGEIIYSRQDKTSLKNKTLTSVFQDIFKKIQSYTSHPPLLGVVVGLSGIINSDKGKILQSKSLNIYKDLSFIDEIKNTISVHLLIENDANCCCWGELTAQKPQNIDNLLFILGGVSQNDLPDTLYSDIGFGFGIVLDGKVYHGEDFAAGEFKSILNNYSRASQFSAGNIKNGETERKPDELTDIFRELSRNISLVINFFNLKEIVIGGLIEQHMEILESMLAQEIKRNWSYPDQLNCTIRKSHKHEKAIAYGAACMFLENLFGIPEVNNASGKKNLRGIELLETI